jgi:hypothetical protein
MFSVEHMQGGIVIVASIHVCSGSRLSPICMRHQIAAYPKRLQIQDECSSPPPLLAMIAGKGLAVETGGTWWKLP